MKENFRIRPAKRNDVPTIAPLIYETLGSANVILGGSDREETIQTIAQICTRSKTKLSYDYAWVVERDDEVYGSLIAYTHEVNQHLLMNTLGHIFKINGWWNGIATLLKNLWILSIQESQPGEYYIFSIAVSEPYRRQGIGTLLLSHAEKLARNQNIDTLSLVVESFNKIAIGCYRSQGYTIVDTQFSKQASSHRMVKKLS